MLEVSQTGDDSIFVPPPGNCFEFTIVNNVTHCVKLSCPHAHNNCTEIFPNGVPNPADTLTAVWIDITGSNVLCSFQFPNSMNSIGGIHNE